MTPDIVPLVRRAILDLLYDIGGEQNDDVLALLLGRLGHRVARRDIRSQLAWLADEGLISLEEVGPFQVVRILADGRDCAEGKLNIDGVSRFKTGE